jgi:uncharacterized membrane protein YkvI
MFNLFNKKKGQALPLNTIVIAILVIIVLVVLIVYFTGTMNENGNALDDTTNSYTSCIGNPAYSKYTLSEVDKGTCTGVTLAANLKNKTKECCGVLKTN